MNKKVFHTLISCMYLTIAFITYQIALHNACTLPHLNPSLRTVDLIIFSYDRPMQLYALCESIEKHIQGLGHITIIYRTSDNEFDNAYRQLQQRFTSINFVQQGCQPAKDFKPILISSLRQGCSPYVCFAVDDMIVKKGVNLTKITQLLEQTHAYAFFLRLGTHISYCYTLNRQQPNPHYTKVCDTIFAWSFKDGQYDWNYANTVDMTVYRKKDIIRDFLTMDYTNPNTLEAAWSQRSKLCATGLCFDISAVVNIPMNLVQDVYNNRSMNSLTPKQLLEKFNQGFKFDIKPLDSILNTSCHITCTLQLVQREQRS